MKKKLTKNQMRIAKMAAPFDVITGADFKALRKGGPKYVGKFKISKPPTPTNQKNKSL
tara:strand:- start:1136 stop:1309 length:174 start_codon:yes stop_codon:yes gene_type:complete